MNRLMRFLGGFLKQSSGAAVVEFALIVPLMLTLYFGCSEAAALLTADRKVQTVSSTIGDLVARSNKTITADQITDYFQAATSVMAPYATANLVQTVTAISISDTGQTSILWSVQFKKGVLSTSVASHPKGKPYALPAEMIAIAKGQMVIASEAYYPYKPMLGLVFKNTLELDRSALFMPRFGGQITLG